MAGISFGDEADTVWIVAGWAFRQVLDDLRRNIAEDRALREAITDAGHIGFLDVEVLREPLRAKMTEAIEHLCRGILDDSIRSGVQDAFPDVETTEAYLEGIQSLIAALQASKPPESGVS